MKLEEIKTTDDAIEYLLPKFKAMEGIDNLIANSEDWFASYCHSGTHGGIGIKIRSGLGLLQGGNPLYRHMIEVEQIIDHDLMVDLLVRKIHKQLNAELCDSQ